MGMTNYIPYKIILAQSMCRPNEIFSGCGDNGCQRRCNRLVITGCTPSCGAPACICKEGFVKNSDNDCIPVTSCR